MSYIKNRIGLILAIIVTLAGILTMFYYFKWTSPIHFNFSKEIDISKASKVGDFIGGVVGTLFALVGIFLLYETLRLQRREFEESRKVFQHQQFENSFFQMLSVHNDIVNSTDIHRKLKNLKGKVINSILLYSGRDCYGYFYRRFKKSFNEIDDKTINTAIEEYETCFEKWDADLGHYFRNMYHIVKYIDENCPKSNNDCKCEDECNCTYKEKKIYTNILRSTLSSNELLLLFYNCLSDYGNEKFAPYIKTYDFLDNIPKGKLIHSSHLPALYEMRGYDDNGNVYPPVEPQP